MSAEVSAEVSVVWEVGVRKRDECGDEWCLWLGAV